MTQFLTAKGNSHIGKYRRGNWRAKLSDRPVAESLRMGAIDRRREGEIIGAKLPRQEVMVRKKKSGPKKTPGKPAKSRKAQEPTIRPSFDDRAFLTSVGPGRASTTFQAKQIIYRQGDPADGVYYIVAGKIQLTVVSEQGKEGVIAMLEPGEFFGEGCIAGQPFRMASASATAKSTVARIEKAAMNRLVPRPATLCRLARKSRTRS